MIGSTNSAKPEFRTRLGSIWQCVGAARYMLMHATLSDPANRLRFRVARPAGSVRLLTLITGGKPGPWLEEAGTLRSGRYPNREAAESRFASQWTLVRTVGHARVI